ncbi:TPA: glycosyltransferase, partial [Morganella morganii]|nr:glycosyltransferase [Morganella morganii]
MNIIPKKIHYVWVGNKPKPQLVLDCISTWEAHFPDYEIIEWNNEKFKDISNKYAEEAFANKRWAFVSDYIRLHALYHEGGIYLDTDVEVTNN